MFFKRLFDIVFSLIAIVILLPLLIILSALIYFQLGSPVFFTQQRVGKNGKIFKLIKFRSMLNSTNQNGELLSDSERLTQFGKILRSTSLDELPQLINVFKGEMSIVGPRPLLVEYVPLYSKRQFTRHNVRPGITGWAQINGRNSITWCERFEYDVWYVENISIALDIKIIFITILRVFKRDGVCQQGNATMEKFNGAN